MFYVPAVILDAPLAYSCQRCFRISQLAPVLPDGSDLAFHRGCDINLVIGLAGGGDKDLLGGVRSESLHLPEFSTAKVIAGSREYSAESGIPYRSMVGVIDPPIADKVLERVTGHQDIRPEKADITYQLATQREVGDQLSVPVAKKDDLFDAHNLGCCPLLRLSQ
jgi:hypothetical protein